MSLTIDYAFTHAFQANLLELSQEGGEGWSSWVRNQNFSPGKTFNVERIAGVEDTAISGRHVATGFTPFTHTRRRGSYSDRGLSEVIDDIDQVKMLISPQSSYARGFAKAYRRRVARTLTSAMLGNAVAVDNADATTNVALPAGQQIANGGTGMTMAKLRQAARILDVNGVALDGRHIAVSPHAIEDLLADSTVTSSDFSTLQALRFGRIPEGSTWMGFMWHIVSAALGAGSTMADPILPVSSNIRSCIAWQREAVVFSEARGFTPEVVRDPSIWNNTRVIVKFVLGAVRVEDEAVVQIDIDETA